MRTIHSGFIRSCFLISGILLLCSSNQTLAQESSPDPYPERVYLEFGAGVDLLSYRDFANSPLIYDGPVLAFTFSYLENSRSDDHEFTINGSYGETTAEVGDFPVGYSTAFVNRMRYTLLYRIERFSGKNWNIKVGGTLSSLISVRQNPSLRNNETGFEAFGTLSGSGSVSRDVSRTSRKNFQFLFLDIPLPPRARTLTLQFHLPVINSALQNNYIYTNQAELVNRDDYLNEYQFRLISGYRMFTSLQYRLYLKNSNAIQFSYDWDALRSPGEAGVFEMAHHSLTFTLLYNLN